MIDMALSSTLKASELKNSIAAKREMHKAVDKVIDEKKKKDKYRCT